MRLSDNESVQSESESEDSGFDQIPIEQLHNQNNTIELRKSRHSFNYNIDLPNAIPISQHHYSLEPDMVFGWAPKLKFNGPICLSFKSLVNDQISDYLLQNEDYPLIYLGFRPQDTIKLHKQFSSPTTYQFKFDPVIENQKLAHLIPLILKYKDEKLPFTGMNQKYPSIIQFDSQFEGGNLDLVIQVQDFEYDLYMRVDSNTRGHLSWFNFKMNGLPPRQNVKLNICNFTKGKCLYTKGMKAYISINEGEWLQGGNNVRYREQSLRYKWVEYSRRYYCLTFEIESKSIQDSFQIAYCVPYSYTKMLQVIKDLSGYTWCQQVKLCQDLSGVNVPLLVISDEDESEVPFNQRKVAIIQARIHPGESNGSWMMHGFLKYLESAEAKQLRQRCILKIIPMVNPDGVILGNYRTGSAGRDLNREFIKADRVLHPSVHAIKQLVADTYAKYGNNLVAFIDMHGHSGCQLTFIVVKKNVFSYGPEFSIWDPNYLKCRILTKLLDDSSDMFRYYSSIFRVSQHKKSTARGVFCNLHEIVNCLTVEASNGFYYSSEQQKSLEFKPGDWTQMGYLIGSCLSELISLIQEFELSSLQRVQQRKVVKINNTGTIQVRRKTNQLRNRLKLSNKPTASLISLEAKQRSIDQSGLQLNSEFESSFQDTKLMSLFDEIKKFETLKKDNPLSDDDSEGRSDSESSQDDDDELVKELRRDIKKINLTSQHGPKRKNFKQKTLIQQKQKRPPLHLLTLQEKPDTAKPQFPMAFGISGGKRPLPYIQASMIERIKSQDDKRVSKNKQKPLYQIITKSMNDGSVPRREPVNNFTLDLTQSQTPNRQHMVVVSSLFSRPLSAFPDLVIEDPKVTSSITQRAATRFKSQPMLAQFNRSPAAKNGVVFHKALNQFQEEKNSILEQQGFIQYILAKHEQQNGEARFSPRKNNIHGENKSLSRDHTEIIDFSLKKQTYQSKLLMDNHTFRLAKDKHFKSVKYAYPSAFYNMKKHLFKKKSPQVDDLQVPMVVKAAISICSKR